MLIQRKSSGNSDPLILQPSLPTTNPLVGFLPVNDPATGSGEGFVNYTIRARQDASRMDIIEAQADIVFDNNDPLATPPVF